MLSWKDVWVQQERYKDVLREAERERLMRQALARVAMSQRFHSRVLRWLGSQLATWGNIKHIMNKPYVWEMGQ